MSFLPKAQLDQLKAFVSVLQTKPEIIYDPALAFFKDYLVSVANVCTIFLLIFLRFIPSSLYAKLLSHCI